MFKSFLPVWYLIFEENKVSCMIRTAEATFAAKAAAVVKDVKKVAFPAVRTVNNIRSPKLLMCCA